jgi:hypothetical protein
VAPFEIPERLHPEAVLVGLTVVIAELPEELCLLQAEKKTKATPSGQVILNCALLPLLNNEVPSI